MLSRWNTDAMFERYLVRNDADLASAVAKRFTPAKGNLRQTKRLPQSPRCAKLLSSNREG